MSRYNGAFGSAVVCKAGTGCTRWWVGEEQQTVRERMGKFVNLIKSTHRLERMFSLLEIRLNRLLFEHKPADVNTITFEGFLTNLSASDSMLFDLLRAGGEAEVAVQGVRTKFKKIAAGKESLPFPASYNADIAFALLSYGLARYLAPELVLETGVGYGVTSALVLLALERNNAGKLVSIDLPSLADPHGAYTGLVVPGYLRNARWRLHLGSSRRCLSSILADVENIGLFISDSANVYTLQRYEFETVWPKLLPGGGMLFNNIGARLQMFFQSLTDIRLYSIWQVEKSSCATGLILKG
jgi:Methyltransferase domain